MIERSSAPMAASVPTPRVAHYIRPGRKSGSVRIGAWKAAEELLRSQSVPGIGSMQASVEHETPRLNGGSHEP